MYVFRNPRVKLSIRFDNTPSLFLRWPTASRVTLTLHGMLHVQKTAGEVIVCHMERTRLAGAQTEPQCEEDASPVRGDGRQDSVLDLEGDYAGMMAKPAARREIRSDKTQALGCAFVDKRQKSVESAQHFRDRVDMQSPRGERGGVLVYVAAIEFEDRSFIERLPVVGSPPLVLGQGVCRTIVAFHPAAKVL
jgi:hypothetical protein